MIPSYSVSRLKNAPHRVAIGTYREDQSKAETVHWGLPSGHPIAPYNVDLSIERCQTKPEQNPAITYPLDQTQVDQTLAGAVEQNASEHPERTPTEMVLWRGSVQHHPSCRIIVRLRNREWTGWHILKNKYSQESTKVRSRHSRGHGIVRSDSLEKR